MREKPWELFQEVLLPAEDTRIWCEHLCQVHCKRISGEKKKAMAKEKLEDKTSLTSSPKRKSRSSEKAKCLQSGQGDPPGTVQAEDDGSGTEWICCDGCNEWCHALRNGISDISERDDWLCLTCSEQWV